MGGRVTLICHAATPAMRRGIFPGDARLDMPVRAALAGLAGRLPARDRAWTSPAACARQTARALGLAAVEALALRDADHGRWAGRGLREIGSAEPAALAAWLADPATAPHGGEDGAALLARVAGWLEERVRLPGRAVAVTHAAVIRAALVHALKVAPVVARHIDVAPLTMTVLTWNAGRWRLRTTGERLRRPGARDERCPTAPPAR